MQHGDSDRHQSYILLYVLLLSDGPKGGELDRMVVRGVDEEQQIDRSIVVLLKKKTSKGMKLFLSFFDDCNNSITHRRPRGTNSNCSSVAGAFHQRRQ